LLGCASLRSASRGARLLRSVTSRRLLAPRADGTRPPKTSCIMRRSAGS
jgi:hypothetical protein